MQILRIGLTGLIVMALTGPLAAADWPQWRGPEDNGISQETKWSAWRGQPKILWKANVGTGFSSMAVADGRLFTLGHRDGQETVYCFDAVTGRTIWTHTYPAKLLDNLHEGGPSATPTVHEGRVYTLGKDGAFFCFDAATGSVHWRKDMLEEVGLRKPPAWGFCCAPYILGDKVIIDGGQVVAFDKVTGRVIWKSQAFKPAYASLMAFENAGRTLLAGLNTDGLTVFNAADGSTVAHARWKTSFNTNATIPLVVGNRIFISTGYNKGCALFELRGDQLVEIYSNRQMSNHMNPCVLVDGHLYGFDGNSHRSREVDLVCMEFATGDVKWRAGGLGCGSLMAADGKLIILSDSGELVIAHATPAELRPIARARVLQGKCWTAPVLANGRIYCRDASGDLVCVDVSE